MHANTRSLFVLYISHWYHGLVFNVLLLTCNTDLTITYLCTVGYLLHAQLYLYVPNLYDLLCGLIGWS